MMTSYTTVLIKENAMFTVLLSVAAIFVGIFTWRDHSFGRAVKRSLTIILAAIVLDAITYGLVTAYVYYAL